MYDACIVVCGACRVCRVASGVLCACRMMYVAWVHCVAICVRCACGLCDAGAWRACGVCGMCCVIFVMCVECVMYEVCLLIEMSGVFVMFVVCDMW